MSRNDGQTTMKPIKTATHINTAAARQNRAIVKLQRRPYLLAPALQRNLASFDPKMTVAISQAFDTIIENLHGRGQPLLVAIAGSPF